MSDFTTPINERLTLRGTSRHNACGCELEVTLGDCKTVVDLDIYSQQTLMRHLRANLYLNGMLRDV